MPALRRGRRRSRSLRRRCREHQFGRLWSTYSATFCSSAPLQIQIFLALPQREEDKKWSDLTSHSVNRTRRSPKTPSSDPSTTCAQCTRRRFNQDFGLKTGPRSRRASLPGPHRFQRTPPSSGPFVPRPFGSLFDISRRTSRPRSPRNPAERPGVICSIRISSSWNRFDKTTPPPCSRNPQAFADRPARSGQTGARWSRFRLVTNNTHVPCRKSVSDRHLGPYRRPGGIDVGTVTAEGHDGLGGRRPQD